MLSARLKTLWEIGGIQFKLCLWANFALAALLCLLVPVFFGIRYLDAYGSSFVLERFVALTGVILLTPLFYPEQDKNISEVVEARIVRQTRIIVTRLAASLIFMAVCIFVMVIFMRSQQCEFDAVKFFTGTYMTALSLGALGFAFYGITNNIAVGYLAALSYYLLNFAIGRRLKMFYMFSLALDNFTPKYWLGGMAVVLISVTLGWRHVVAKLR